MLYYVDHHSYFEPCKGLLGYSNITLMLSQRNCK